MSRGRFVTLEGGEGAGKSTQTALLAEALRSAGLEVVTTREPGGAPGAEEIRKLLVEGEIGRWDPISELLLYAAARRDHVRTLIAPSLARGAWVLCDRFSDSTMAYQGYGHGLGAAPVEAVQRLAIGDLVPDLTLILDLPPEIGLARARGRRKGGTRYERMDLDFHRRLRDGFLAIARRAPARCRVIDARGPVQEVQSALRNEVSRCLLVQL
ncbi:MAG TPA: dTMP kinase [Alphaproteobacteria bacterium]|nr:dTMP kinase [Alphaproteobacteria bacterium]